MMSGGYSVLAAIFKYNKYDEKGFRKKSHANRYGSGYYYSCL